MERNEQALKKISLLLIFCMLLGVTPVKAEENYENAAVIANYSWAWNKEQGVDGWYYASFANGVPTQLVWNTEKSRWTGDTGYPSIASNGSMMPTTSYDVGMVFKAPTKGMVRIKGNGNLYYPWGEAYAASDGVNVSIVKNGKVLWSTLVKWGEKPSYDVVTSVREGQEIYFIMNCNKNSGYDDVLWKPSVSYIAADYKGEGGGNYTYFEKVSGNLSELQYDAVNDNFKASDGIGFISAYDIMPTDTTSFVKRYTVEADSRYRVSGNLTTTDNRGGGTVVTVYKNNDPVWKQMCPENTENDIDVRMRANKGDVIDIEIGVDKFGGFNYTEYALEVSRIPGTVPVVSATTSKGDTYGVGEEISLSSLITDNQSGQAKFYVNKNDVMFLMDKYSGGTWTSSDDNTAQSTPCKITNKSVSVGVNDAVIDVEMKKDGIIKLSGDFGFTGNSDGMVFKIYKNDSLLWSNRVGGERSVRWDEPYDVSYFQNEVNAVAEVKAGDVLRFRFNRWRLHTGDTLNIDDIKISYVTGIPLSKTTKWKLNQSTVIDTEKKVAYKKGEAIPVDVYLENGTTYILTEDAKKLYPVCPDTTQSYLPVRKVLEANGMAVTWAADRFVLTHDYIEVFFGYPELSEIKVAAERGALY